MKNKCTPDIRFKDFNDNWDSIVLNDVLKYEQPTKYIVESTEYSDTFNVPVLTAGQSFILGYTNETFNIKKCSKDNPLIIFDDFTTSSHFVDFNFKIKSSAMKLLISKNELRNNYFDYLLLKNINYIPAAHGRHWISEFSKFEVLNPNSLVEQHKIANYFQNIDKLIEQTRNKLTILNKNKESLLNKIFSNDTLIPEIRFKEFDDKWKTFKFNKYVNLNRGLTYSPTDVRTKGIRVLRSSNILNSEFYLCNDDVFVTPSCVNIDLIQNNDILITAANGSSNLVGKHAIINNVNEKCVCGGFMIVAKTKFPYYINASMSSKWYKNFLQIGISGGNGSLGNLNKNLLSNYPVNFPTNTLEIEKIGFLFNKLDNLISSYELKLSKLESIKKSLLNKMFI